MANNKNNKKAKEEFDLQSKGYFESIKIKPVLHLPIFETKVLSDECEIILPPTSCVILWIYEEYKLFQWIDIIFVKTDKSDGNESANSKFENSNGTIANQPRISYTCRCDPIMKILQTDLLIHNEDVRFKMFQFSSHSPIVFIPEKQLLISGLCSILRFIVKFAYMKIDSLHQLSNNKDVEGDASDARSLQALLGFRGGCLRACAEVSGWSKFFEVDIFDGLKEALKTTGTKKELSIEVLRFECHLREPVKMHNIRKEQQNLATTDLHDFAEGPRMLLPDLVIYPCICLFHSLYGPLTFEKYFPKTTIWYSKMNSSFLLSRKLKLCELVVERFRQIACSGAWEVPQATVESFYRTPCIPNSVVRTRQTDVDDALDSVHSRNIPLSEVIDVAEFLNWDGIPPLAHPTIGGQLPPNRRDKKCVQLSALTVEVMKLVEVIEKKKDNNCSKIPLRIVDFCSGGGHLGILLAWLLPQCQIILVENKEESLRRAWDRVERMKLRNVLLYQQNLSYFDLDFQIGIALHACGQGTIFNVSLSHSTLE